MEVNLKSKKYMLSAILSGAFLLSACASATQPPAVVEEAQAAITQAAVGEQAEEPIMGHNPASDMDTGDGAGSMQENDQVSAEAQPGESEPKAEEMTPDLPAYFSTSLTDVSTGQNFTIQGNQGKVILVENMAMWCTTCLRQQGEVKTLHAQLGERDDFLSVGLDIDPNENAQDLKAYLANNGFDWLYAVPPAEVVREIDQLYGTQFLNPPSAPMFIIDRKGQVHPLPFGVKSASDLLSALEPLLNEGK